MLTLFRLSVLGLQLGLQQRVPMPSSWQAIIMGNLLMSGITHDTQEITLVDNDPSTLLAAAPSIHEFVSLFTLNPTCGTGYSALSDFTFLPMISHNHLVLLLVELTGMTSRTTSMDLLECLYDMGGCAECAPAMSSARNLTWWKPSTVATSHT